MVIIDTVVHRGDDGNGLLVVHVEEFWLSTEWLLQLNKLSCLLCVEVKLHDRLFFGEEDVGRISAMLCGLETELHANAVEFLSLLNIDGLDKLEFVHGIHCIQVLFSLEQEELVWLLLVHNQVLSTDNRKNLLVLRDLH